MEIKTVPNLKNGKVIWLFGLPCAGKTSVGKQLAELLEATGQSVITLDGDEVRSTINSDLKFSDKEREENIRRSSEMAKLLANKGFVVVCSFITPTIRQRDLVRKIIGIASLTMIYINAPIEECIRRDSKGHYRQAQEGAIADFTGIGSAFEMPDETYNSVNTNELGILEAAKKCLGYIR